MEMRDSDEAHGLVSIHEETHFPMRQAGPPTFPLMSQVVYADPELSSGLTQ